MGKDLCNWEFSHLVYGIRVFDDILGYEIMRLGH